MLKNYRKECAHLKDLLDSALKDLDAEQEKNEALREEIRDLRILCECYVAEIKDIRSKAKAAKLIIDRIK